MKNKIVLITACGNKKEDKPTVAGKLYKSARIRHLYRRAKELNIPFYILSAKYGLVSGDEVIEPYDAIMNRDRCAELEENLIKVLENFDTIIYYRGGARKEYLECIEKVASKLNKNLISFGYGNMGDIKKLDHILGDLLEKYKRNL